MPKKNLDVYYVSTYMEWQPRCRSHCPCVLFAEAVRSNAYRYTELTEVPDLTLAQSSKKPLPTAQNCKDLRLPLWACCIPARVVGEMHMTQGRTALCRVGVRCKSGSNAIQTNLPRLGFHFISFAGYSPPPLSHTRAVGAVCSLTRFIVACVL
jgi:hypothetical protein